MDLWTVSDAERSSLRNRTMGFVFQFPSLIPGLSLEQNVTLPLEFSQEEHRTVGGGRGNCSRLVGLGHRAAALPRELSAGQQQRVVIARALINRPTLLLADEPSSDLDQDTEREIMEIFGRIHGEQGLTVVHGHPRAQPHPVRHAPPRDGRRHRTRGRGLGRPRHVTPQGVWRRRSCVCVEPRGYAVWLGQVRPKGQFGN